MSQPALRSLTWADYEKLPDDGNRYEILEGELVMVPAPDLRHQGVSWQLCSLLDRWKRESSDRGTFFSAPADVELGEHSIVQPDILYIRSERLSELAGKHVTGAPDLAVEIFNRASAARDGVEKLQMYAKHGVREYWLVDLDARHVMMLELVEGMYKAIAQGSDETPLASHVLPGFVLRPVEIFG